MYFACIYSVSFDKYWRKKFDVRIPVIAVRNSGPKWLQWLLLYGCQIVKLSNCHLTLGQSLSGSDASMVLVHLNRVCVLVFSLWTQQSEWAWASTKCKCLKCSAENCQIMVLVTTLTIPHSHDTQTSISNFKCHMIRQPSLSYLGNVEKQEKIKHE